jgi:hypothetical protein
MTKPFEAAEIKIERATRHLQGLQAEIEGFFRRGGVYVAFEIADEYKKDTFGAIGSFTYREKEPIPTQWSAIIGDILHNLRASLDLVACDLHRLSSGRANELSGVYYPFCKTKDDLPQKIRDRRLGHIAKEFRDIIEQTRPYKDGNPGLRAVHDLNIIDKHQTIVPTIAVVSIDWPVMIKEGPKQFTTGVQTDGQRLMIFPQLFCQLPLGSKIKADFSIVFGDVPVFRGAEVVKQLRACLESIEVIVGLFKAAAGDKPLPSVRGP